jgi:uncharacterized membrane protein
MEPLASLIAANVAFVGGHFAMSHPLRAPMVRMLGDKGFLGVYSLVSFATLGWVGHAFGMAPAAPLWGDGGDLVWVIASLLTILALALLIGSLRGNPALPDTPVEKVAAARATGAFAITRHPMMWGIAIWALSHVIVWPSPRTLVTAGAMGVLALLGARLQDRKKEALLGEAWTRWEAETTYWPRLGKLGGLGASAWAIAIVIWFGVTWLHIWLGGIAAGAWRWMGF